MRAADLEVYNVSWAPTKSAQPVLHPTTFRVAAGRVLGVVGPNGAGKSTLLRLLYRFQQPKTGYVRVGGQDIWSMPARNAARRIAAVLQEQASAFGLTVREIVRLGRTPHRSGFATSGAGDEQVVDRVLTTLSLRSLADRDFGTLSGGERQRVMVARALAQDPQVLILDEPTNHLDVRHQLEVVSLIQSLGLTIVVSLHDLNMASGVCDDVLILKNGQPQGFGPPQSLLTDTLVSDTFRVDARREHLASNGASHFSFTLPN
ncbi:ABC transporter ATP-binding protein [Octadecabacter antarcticus 307]|uniref:ABC transporter ATP-binding protein n=1 Tax=Octadecabacter antarcticus 307 TaxID=391626 RepID=M9R4G1_9RHOB|nr:ABC transporter ATP-binding protein [Octadecabacter antarcticus]AGI66668.1 ABC transporter ATP-binding protein [Octadecabacter antarcticus 307]